jgi:hypothetical protein
MEYDMVTSNPQLHTKKVIETPMFYHDIPEPLVDAQKEMMFSEIRQKLDEVERELQTGVQPLDGREVFSRLRGKYGY